MEREKRGKESVKESENKGGGGRDYIFLCLIDLKSALCHVEKLCFRQRCFVWVITAALAAKGTGRIHSYIYTLRSAAFLPLAQCFWPVHVQPLSCPFAAFTLPDVSAQAIFMKEWLSVWHWQTIFQMDSLNGQTVSTITR